SVKSLRDQRGLTETLRREVYSEPALSPAFPWLDNTPPAQPALSLTTDSSGNPMASWSNKGAEAVSLWVLQTKNATAWRTSILPASKTSCAWWGMETPEAVSLTAVDRCGNLSAPVVLEKRSDAPRR